MAEQKIPVWVRIGEKVFKGEVEASFENAPLQGLILQLGEDKQSPPIPLENQTEEEETTLISDLSFQKSHTWTAYVGKSIPVEFKTFDGTRQLEVDTIEEGIERPVNATVKWDFDYEIIRTLAAGIQSYDGKALGKNRKEKEERLFSIPWVIVQYLLRCWNVKHNQIAGLLEPTVVQEILRK